MFQKLRLCVCMCVCMCVFACVCLHVCVRECCDRVTLFWLRVWSWVRSALSRPTKPTPFPCPLSLVRRTTWSCAGTAPMRRCAAIGAPITGAVGDSAPLRAVENRRSTRRSRSACVTVAAAAALTLHANAHANTKTSSADCTREPQRTGGDDDVGASVASTAMA